MGFSFCLPFLMFGLYATTNASPSITDCGKLENKNKIPWTVGVYLEKVKDHLELICLGTVLGDNYVLTASQCVCETLSKDVRKENIYVSKEIQKVLKKNSNSIEIKSRNVLKPKEYQGFLLNPIGDLAILKIQGTSGPLGKPICVDWSDLTKVLQLKSDGVSSVWDSGVKTIDFSFLDYDSCSSLSSQDFGRILSSDKHCFKTSGSNLDSHSIGAGIYYQNPKDGKWYIEGVVSGSEKEEDTSVLLAATSIRRYLSWLSRTCIN